MPSLASIPLEDLLEEIRRRRDLIDAHGLGDDPWRPVVAAVARAFGVAAADLWRPGRRVVETQARQAAMVIMRERLGMTLEAVGEVFRKDHGTVSFALRGQPGRMTDRKYRLAFEAALTALTHEN